MIKRLIQIPTNNEKIYLHILSVMNFIVDVTPQEREVLSEIIKFNNDYLALEENLRAEFILSTSTRKKMRENIGLGDKQFNSLLLRLKKKELFGKPLISKEGVLHPELMFNPDDEGYEIIIRMKKEPILNSTTQEEPANPKKVKEEVKPKEPKKNAEISKEEKIPKLANGEDNIIEDSYKGNITLL